LLRSAKWGRHGLGIERKIIEKQIKELLIVRQRLGGRSSARNQDACTQEEGHFNRQQLE
jgi:hypothetical protein